MVCIYEDGGVNMQIVVIEPGKFVGGILRVVFGISKR